MLFRSRGYKTEFVAKLKAYRGNGYEFGDKMGRGGMEDAANLTTSLVKSNLEGVNIGGLANVCKPSFSTVSKDRDNNGGDDMPPRN